jgi:hypothetical protein
MESLRITLPATTPYNFPVRHAHAGESILRAVLMIEIGFTPTSDIVWSLCQYRFTAQIGSAGALGTLIWPGTIPVVGFTPYDFALPATEGALVYLEENDVVVLQFTGPAQSLPGVALSLG